MNSELFENSSRTHTSAEISVDLRSVPPFNRIFLHFVEIQNFSDFVDSLNPIQNQYPNQFQLNPVGGGGVGLYCGGCIENDNHWERLFINMTNLLESTRRIFFSDFAFDFLNYFKYCWRILIPKLGLKQLKTISDLYFSRSCNDNKNRIINKCANFL